MILKSLVFRGEFSLYIHSTGALVSGGRLTAPNQYERGSEEFAFVRLFPYNEYFPCYAVFELNPNNAIFHSPW